MGYKLVNKTNGNEKFKYFEEEILKRKDFENEEEYSQYLQSLELKRNFAREMFCDNIQTAKTGKIVTCTKWEQVAEILDCFDNTDNWIIEEVQEVFYITTNPKNTKQVNKFKNFKKALENGKIIDLEE